MTESRNCQGLLAIYMAIFSLMYSPTAYSIDAEELLAKLEAPSTADPAITKQSYTINFSEISIVEFIRFVSKITNLNFIFEEQDLQFTVTITSEEEVSAQNVMSVLAQVLRSHDLSLLEQGGNVLITRSTSINQIPTIISGDLPHSDAGNAMLVTRVFRIKNANAASLATIIRPLMSKGSLIDVSIETRQLIVTDITTNVDKIATLLASLDAPHSPLDIESYVVRHVSPEALIQLAQQIVQPFAEGNPLHFVPQGDTNSIFIISTPHLIERSLTVMEDLDKPASPEAITQRDNATVFLYKALNRTPDEIMESLRQIDKDLAATLGVSHPLRVAVHEVQELKSSGSLMFVASPATTVLIKELLLSLDTPSIQENTAAWLSAKTEFLIYNPKNRPGQEVQKALRAIATHVKGSTPQDPLLVQCLELMQWYPANNSLVFVGSAPTLKKVQDLLQSLDVETQGPQETELFVYKPQYVTSDEILSALHEMRHHLDSESGADYNMLRAIEEMRYDATTSSFTLSTDAATAARLRKLFVSLDTPQIPSSAQTLFVYKLQHVRADAIVQELTKIVEKIVPQTRASQDLISAIRKIEVMQGSKALLLTGSAGAIESLKVLLGDLDVPGEIQGATASFFVYQPKELSPQEMQKAIGEIVQDLKLYGLVDPELLASLEAIHYVEATDSFIATGTPPILSKVQELLTAIDSPQGKEPIHSMGETGFLVYQPKLADPQVLLASLKQVAVQLPSGTSEDRSLKQTIDSVRFSEENQSLLFTGPQQTLQKINALLEKLDVASGQNAQSGLTARDVSAFVIYSPRYINGEELMAILREFEQNLKSSGVVDSDLFGTIENMKWIEKTSSLLISGDPTSIQKVQDLLVKFDTSQFAIDQSIAVVDNTNFLVYKLQYHQGSDIQVALQQVAQSLDKNSSGNLQAMMSAINSLQWIQVTNSIVGTGPQDVLNKIRHLIQNLDIPLRQVFIEVLVIETTLNNTQNFGLMWGGQMQYLNKLTMGTGNFPQPGSVGGSSSATSPVSVFGPNLGGVNATNTPRGGIAGTTTGTNGMVPFTNGFDLGVIGDIIMHKGKSFVSLGSLVNALQLDVDTTIVMNPKIIAQDNKQANIFVGQNIPFAGAVVQTVTGNTGQQTTSNLEYRDVGVNLTITPMLGDDGVVSMDIVHDISEQTLNTTSSSASTLQLTGIQTTHTHMETSIHVPNEYFVVLSGMLRDEKNYYRSGIPCLGSLPVVGALFSENDRTNQKNNVMIFLKPHIITSYAQFKEVTEHQEWLYKDQVRLPTLKENIDDGLNYLKTPEDE